MFQENPCIHCGACCAFFRVSFYWEEADEEGETALKEMTEDSPPFCLCMKGTNQKKPYCVALEGKIGQTVDCAVYNSRSSTCREFGVHWQDGEIYFEDEGDLERCDHARVAWGLPPLNIPPKIPSSR